MAAIAGDLSGAVKVARIQFQDHSNHLARFRLVRLYVSFVGSLMAVLTTDPKGIGEEGHGPPELLFGQVFQHLDILEEIAGELRCSELVVRKRVSRGLARMREQLKETGST